MRVVSCLCGFMFVFVAAHVLRSASVAFGRQAGVGFGCGGRFCLRGEGGTGRWTDGVRRSFLRTMATAGGSVPSEFVIAYCTVPDETAGEKVTNALVERRLAACVNAIPGVKSSYWWEGQVEHSNEILLLIKTRHALLDDVLSTVQSMHPYDVPELITAPITAGLPAYLDWLRDSTQPPNE